MHILTVQTRFTFGDRVQFNSPTQSSSGVGKVVAITIDAARQVDYLIEIEHDGTSALQAGILEEEITLLGEEEGQPR